MIRFTRRRAEQAAREMAWIAITGAVMAIGFFLWLIFWRQR
ncbi:MAG: hypothetical protein AB7O91_04160 [Sphingomonas sp.]